MTKKKITIIDADSIVYILAYALSQEHPNATKISGIIKTKILGNVDQFVSRILDKTEADEYLGYFGKVGGKKCFRYDRAETIGYKHARKPKEDWFIMYQGPILDQLENFWNFEGVEGYEADDYVCQSAAKFRDDGDDVTVAAIDKDIRQLTGVKHYSYNPSGLVSKDVITQTDAEAYYQLYSLMLEGDASDGYKGIPGVGKTKTIEILKDCKTENEFEEATKEAYKYWFTGGLLEKAIAKQLKDHYALWKDANPGKRLTKAIKEDEIHADLEEFFEASRKRAKSSLTWKDRYSEMFDLAKLPDTGDYHNDIIITDTFKNKFKKASGVTKLPYNGMKGMLDKIT